MFGSRANLAVGTTRVSSSASLHLSLSGCALMLQQCRSSSPSLVRYGEHTHVAAIIPLLSTPALFLDHICTSWHEPRQPQPLRLLSCLPLCFCVSCRGLISIAALHRTGTVACRLLAGPGSTRQVGGHRSELRWCHAVAPSCGGEAWLLRRKGRAHRKGVSLALSPSLPLVLCDYLVHGALDRSV